MMQTLRCTNCGDRLSERVANCGGCGLPVVIRPAFAPAATGENPTSFLDFLDPAPLPQTRPTQPLLLPSGGYAGRVLLVEHSGHEREDFRLGHLFARGLLVVIAACSPLLILAAALVVLGPGAVLLAVGGGWLLSRVVSPGAMFGAWLALWGRRTEPAGEPVLYFRLRTRDDGELMVRAKGRLRQGHIAAGDALTCWGRWQHGVLLLRRAYNHATNSWIEPRPRDLWLALLLVLALSAGAIAILLSAAAQVVEQTPYLP